MTEEQQFIESAEKFTNMFGGLIKGAALAKDIVSAKQAESEAKGRLESLRAEQAKAEQAAAEARAQADQHSRTADRYHDATTAQADKIKRDADLYAESTKADADTAKRAAGMTAEATLADARRKAEAIIAEAKGVAEGHLENARRVRAELNDLSGEITTRQAKLDELKRHVAGFVKGM